MRAVDVKRESHHIRRHRIISVPLATMRSAMAMAALLLITVATAAAEGDASQQVVFENSLSPAGYFYSLGSASEPSRLKLVEGHLPVQSVAFISAPNALELSWQSAANGEWDAGVKLYNWRNRRVDFRGDSLYLWLYAPEGMDATALPNISLIDLHGGFTAPLKMGRYTGNLPKASWMRLRIPIAEFQSFSRNAFQPRRLEGILFSQSASDGVPHTLYVDDIRIENVADQALRAPQPPVEVTATGYERHVDIHWQAENDPKVAQYVIYRALPGEGFQPVGVQRPGVQRFTDYVGKTDFHARYRVTARTSSLLESAPSTEAPAATHPMSDDELLTMVEEASFRYYWEGNEPVSGMARESLPGDDDVIATGASGFGIMAMVVGAERGFAPREQVVERMLRITGFLARADRIHGAWPHFLSGSTGHVVPLFGIFDDGADLVETSFLLQGLLTARQCFHNNTPKEAQLRREITSLWEGVEWDWFRVPGERDALYWHWSPNWGFRIANRLEGWNEVMITYVLAIASPTHPVPASLYESGYTHAHGEHHYGEQHRYYGIDLAMNYTPGSPGPLFFTQYSYLGYDPRGWHDRFTNYFVNNRNEALISHAYSVEDPKHWKGYGADAWGLTAVDGPDGYHEYKPFTDDDGTLAPTGAIASYAYAPAESLAALKHYYRDLGAQLWDIYGFRDSFNQQLNWYSGIYMGLNQAPQTVMIENGRTQLVWHYFMKNEEIGRAQRSMGLQPDGPASE